MAPAAGRAWHSAGAGRHGAARALDRTEDKKGAPKAGGGRRSRVLRGGGDAARKGAPAVTASGRRDFHKSSCAGFACRPSGSIPVTAVATITAIATITAVPVAAV